MMVETSKVGVKVGMVGRGVMDAVGVAEGREVRVGVGDGVEVACSTTGISAVGVADGACPQAVRRNMLMSSPIMFRFTDFPPVWVTKDLKVHPVRSS